MLKSEVKISIVNPASIVDKGIGRFWALCTQHSSQYLLFNTRLTGALEGYAALVIAMLCIAMTTASCGFQLRGEAAIPYKTLFIETAGYSPFANNLQRAIHVGSKTKVVQNREEAEAVLKIVGESEEKRILSLSSGGKVREFELHYKVTYRLIDRAGRDLAPPGQIDLRRDMTYDDTQVLAKESEEVLLYRDMKTDAVQQMLRRLSVAKPVA